MKIGSKSLLFLGFIFLIFCMEFARRQYLQTKNENEGFSKASDAAKMTGKVTLFIILLIIFYAGAFFLGSGLIAGGGGGNPAILPIVGTLVTGPFALAYYLAFVLIN